MQNLNQQWAAVRDAPLLYIGSLLVVLALVWAAIHFLYRQRLESKDERIEALKDELARAKAEPLPQQTASEAMLGTPKIPHRVILAEVRTTASKTLDALATRDEKRMRDQLPELMATFLTLSKFYGFRTPTFVATAPVQRCMKAGARYLNDITPFLRQGHIREAGETAEALVPTLEDFVSGERAAQ